MYITDAPIDVVKFLSCPPDSACGATASFVGIVRNHDHGRSVQKLYYDCYAPMAERVMEELIQEAKSRWPIDSIRILHRIGELKIGETAVAIAASSAHRDEAFSACRFAIEEIKMKAPIWKKEFYEDGASEWVLCCKK